LELINWVVKRLLSDNIASLACLT
jgi:hypothetical protein